MSWLDYAFAVLVVFIMPLRAWNAYRHQTPQMPNSKSYIFGTIEKLALFAVLLFLLREKRIPFPQIGLGTLTVGQYLLQTLVCTAVVVGLDLLAIKWLRHNFSRRQLLSQPNRLVFQVNSAIPPKKSVFAFSIFCFVAAFWEELCFRCVTPLFAFDIWSYTVAVFVSSCVFGLHHLRLGTIVVRHTIFYGVLFSALYATYGNLIPVATAHALGNIFAVFYTVPKIRAISKSQPVII